MPEGVGLRLGETGNLLDGLRPVWETGGASGSPLAPPPYAALTTFPLEVSTDRRADWELPTVTLHDDLESVLSTLYEYRVLQFSGDGGEFLVPSGALLLHPDRRAAALRSLGAYLGVDEAAEWGYMLVRLRRSAGWASHEVFSQRGARPFDRLQHLSSEGRRAQTRLRPGRRVHRDGSRDASITPEEAEQYIDSFYSHGTHFISGIELGDVLFQVFAYGRTRFAELSAGHDRDNRGAPVTDHQALGYDYYTGPGWVAEYGHILSLSRDPLLAEQRSRGRWHDGRRPGRESIFAPFAGDPVARRATLASLSQAVPIAVELMPLNRFMEYYRALSWQRVFKGALFQVYGDQIRLSVPTSPAAQPGPLVSVVAEMPPAPVIAGRVELCRDRLVLADLQVARSGTVESVTACSRMLVTGGRAAVAVPGKSVTIVSQVVEGAARSDEAPLVLLDDVALASLLLVFQTMQGIVVLGNRSGTEREVVLDGFRFATAPPDATGRRRVGLRLGPDRSDVAGRLRAANVLARALMTAELGRYAHRAADASPDQEDGSYLDWLVVLRAAGTEDAATSTERVSAVLLAWLGARTPDDSLPESVDDLDREPMAGIIAEARELCEDALCHQAALRAHRQRATPALSDDHSGGDGTETVTLWQEYAASVTTRVQAMEGHYARIVARRHGERCWFQAQRVVDDACEAEIASLAEHVASQPWGEHDAHPAQASVIADLVYWWEMRALLILARTLTLQDAAIATTPGCTVLPIGRFSLPVLMRTLAMQEHQILHVRSRSSAPSPEDAAAVD